MTNYVKVLDAVSAGTLAMIAGMSTDPDTLDEGLDFGMTVRQTAATTRESLTSLASLVDSIKTNSRLSRILREPTDRLVEVLGRFTEATSVADEWDRQLQLLGVPLPPEDWAPEESQAPEAGDGQ